MKTSDYDQENHPKQTFYYFCCTFVVIKLFGLIYYQIFKAFDYFNEELELEYLGHKLQGILGLFELNTYWKN